MTSSSPATAASNVSKAPPAARLDRSDAELLLDRVAERGGALVIHGEPGIGNPTLLR
jgi:hypothetical protein